MGRDDQKGALKEFAKGEDVGHGVDHDCQACRKNRQALKLAGLSARDIKGLEGGKPPATPPLVEDVPTSTDALAQSAASQAVVSFDPNDKPVEGVIQQVLDDNPEIRGKGAALTPINLDAAARGDTPLQQAAAAIERGETAQRHMRMLSLSKDLDDALTNAMVPRGFDRAVLEEWGHDEFDLADAVAEVGGRFMLMRGFIPDDTDWHCEIGLGSERSHVKHPHKHTAIKLAVLLALDPKAGAPLNNAFTILLAEERPRQAPPGHWVGTGLNP